MAIDIQKFQGYAEFERAEKVARRRASILNDTFVILRRDTDAQYIIASRLHPGTQLELTVSPDDDI